MLYKNDHNFSRILLICHSVHCYLSFTFLKDYLCACMCVCMSFYVQSVHGQRLEGVGSPRTEVIGSHELVDVGNQTQVLCKNTKCSY